MSVFNCAATPVTSSAEAPDAVTGLAKFTPPATSRKVPPVSATVEPPTPPATISSVPVGTVKVDGTLLPDAKSSASVAPLEIVGVPLIATCPVNSSRPELTASAPAELVPANRSVPLPFFVRLPLKTPFTASEPPVMFAVSDLPLATVSPPPSVSAVAVVCSSVPD